MSDLDRLSEGVAAARKQYSDRLAGLRRTLTEHVYNPPVDPAQLEKDAIAVQVAGSPRRSMMPDAVSAPLGRPSSLGSTPGRSINEIEPEARNPETTTRNSLGSMGREEWTGPLIGGNDAEDEEGQEDPGSDAEGVRSEGGKGDLLRVDQQGNDQRDRDQHRAQEKGEEEEVWVKKTFEAETKEAVSELIPADAVGVTYKRVWKATALVKR